MLGEGPDQPREFHLSVPAVWKAMTGSTCLIFLGRPAMRLTETVVRHQPTPNFNFLRPYVRNSVVRLTDEIFVSTRYASHWDRGVPHQPNKFQLPTTICLKVSNYRLNSITFRADSLCASGSVVNPSKINIVCGPGRRLAAKLILQCLSVRLSWMAGTVPTHP